MADYRFKSPPLILKEVSSLIKQHGKEVVSSGRKFRDERELFFGAVFSLGQTSVNGQYAWVHKTEIDPPDIECTWLEPSADGNVRCLVEVEIVEFTKKTDDDLYNILKKKISFSYPKNYILLCCINRGGGENYFPKDIYNKIKLLDVKITAIYLIFFIDYENITLVQVFPEFVLKTFNIVKVANNWPKDLSHVVSFKRGK